LKLLIPTGIDLSGLNRTEADTGAYLLHTLARKSRATGQPITTPHGLHRHILYAVGGKNYKYLLTVLAERGIINAGKFYEVGYSSKQYAIATPARLERYEVKDPLALKRIANARAIQTKYTLLLNPHLKGQYDFIKQLTLDADSTRSKMQAAYGQGTLIDGYKKLVRAYGALKAREVAEAFINSNTLEKKRLRKQLKFTSEQYKWLNRNAEKYRKLHKRIIEIDAWKELQQASAKDKWVRMSTSKRTGRLFTNVTSTPKDVRKELKYNGESLVELDASSAQWALLVDLLETHSNIRKGIKELKTSKEVGERGGVSAPTTKRPNPVHPLCVSLESELAKLRELVSSGTFNAYMHQRIQVVGKALNVGGQRPTLFKLPDTVKETKLLLISRVLFEDPRRGYLQSELAYITFKREFPAVLRWIEYLKTDGYQFAAGAIATGEKPYSALALRLQAMEAEVFIELLPQYLNVPYCTIHDAVLVPESSKGAVLSALEALIADYNLPMRIH